MAAQGGDILYSERLGIPGTITVNDIKTFVVTGTMGVVVHGATASTPRPSGYAAITWIGSADPENKQTNDIWYQT